MPEIDPFFNPTTAAEWAPPDPGDQYRKVADSVWQLVMSVDKDDFNIVRLKDENVAKFKGLMEEFGAATEPPEFSEVVQGIDRARLLVESDHAESELRRQPFMLHYEFNRITEGADRRILAWEKENGKLYISANDVTGAAMDPDWSGRDAKTYEKEGNSVQGSGFAAIKHYALLPTKLPDLEAFALNLVLTDDGPVFRADHGYHRLAAARLRGGEELGFTSLVVYDARAQSN